MRAAGYRYRDRKHGPAPWRGGRFDIPIVFAEQGFADAQSQSGPAPRPLGGEEGIEDMRQDFRRNARTVVLKHDPDGIGIASEPNPDRPFFPALANRLVRVQDQIQ